MKKVIALCLVIVMCLSPVAYGASTTQLEEQTFELLNDAYLYNSAEMACMLVAWAFTIENADPDTLEELLSLYDDFCEYMDMTEDEVIEALTDGYGFTLSMLSKKGSDGETRDEKNGLDRDFIGFILIHAEIALPVARYYYEKKLARLGSLEGKEVDTDAMLEQIKENLRLLKDKSEAYDMLKEYYLVVNKMSKWIDDPKGSFASTSDDLDESMKKVDTIKDELELMIG